MLADPALVGVMHRSRGNGHDLNGTAGVGHESRQVLREAPAVDQLHREVEPPLVLADLVNGHDVGVIELGRVLGLGAEARDLLGRRQVAGENHLQRDHAVEPDVPRLEHHAHSSAGDLLDQLVIAESPSVRDPWITVRVDGKTRADRRTVAKRSDKSIESVLIGEVFGELGGQRGMAVEEFLAVDGLSRLDVLEVGGDHLGQARVARDRIVQRSRHGLSGHSRPRR
jgi:hypothetical protein